jgi:hypothetical protein
MHRSASEYFEIVTAAWEGVVPWLYLDVAGLVTIGYGCLVDPLAIAVGLPFVRKLNGTAASRAEIAAEWLRVKADPLAAKAGHRSLEKSTELRLLDVDITSLLQRRVYANEGILATRFAPHWDSWPADAQLAVHAWAWAVGVNAHKKFPHMTRALQDRRFTDAANESKISKKNNAGVIPRNVGIRAMLSIAADVHTSAGDPSVLHYRLGEAALPPPCSSP